MNVPSSKCINHTTWSATRIFPCMGGAAVSRRLYASAILSLAFMQTTGYLPSLRCTSVCCLADSMVNKPTDGESLGLDGIFRLSIVAWCLAQRRAEAFDVMSLRPAQLCMLMVSLLVHKSWRASILRRPRRPSIHQTSACSLPGLQSLHFQILQLEAKTMTKLQRAVINFMSDTITCPTPAMRKAIAAAKVGDDVYGLDPTVLQLQKVAASMLGKEDAMFVPSGTMSNLIAIGTHCQRGDEVICGNKSHIFTYEGAGASAYMGVSLATLPNQKDGTIKISDMARAVRADDIHYPRTSLVEIENTHNTCGGRVLPLSYIREVEQFCKEHNLSLHVDGARLANASVASGVAMEDLVKGADTVSLCLSKGLGAPVGSILAGSVEFIHRAKRLRKSLGGGLRQSGLLAAGALYALEHQFDRLVEDHENAKALAHGLSTIPGIEIDVDSVDTNMLFFKVSSDFKIDTPTLVKRIAEQKGIVFGGYWRGEEIRAVTNLHVTSDDVEYTIASVRDIIAASESNFQVA